MPVLITDCTLYFAGISKTNDGGGGPAAWAFYILNGESVRIAEGTGFIAKHRKTTQKQAENAALAAGLRWLQYQRFFNIDTLTVRGDNEKLIRRIRGEKKVKNDWNQDLVEQHRRIATKIEAGTIEFKWITREENKEAVGMAEQELDS